MSACPVCGAPRRGGGDAMSPWVVGIVTSLIARAELERAEVAQGAE